MAVSKSELAGRLAIPALLVLMVALLPLSLRLDDKVDRNRPMYDDLATMEWLQYQSLVQGEAPRKVEIGPGESATVAGQEFTPSAGVTVAVRTDGPTSYCVRVSNEHGDRSPWHCFDPDEPPIDPHPEAEDVEL